MSDLFEAIFDWFGFKLENRSLPKWLVISFQLVFGLAFLAFLAVAAAGWWYL